MKGEFSIKAPLFAVGQRCSLLEAPVRRTKICYDTLYFIGNLMIGYFTMGPHSNSFTASSHLAYRLGRFFIIAVIIIKKILLHSEFALLPTIQSPFEQPINCSNSPTLDLNPSIQHLDMFLQIGTTLVLLEHLNQDSI